MKEFNFPENHEWYIDKYFLRARTVLEAETLNPKVLAQVFIRKGNCKAYGLEEAIACLCNYTDIRKTGHIYSLKDGDYFDSCETLMLIEAPVQSIIDLETMYLGIISAETTLGNDEQRTDVGLGTIIKNMKTVVDLISPRPISYFGARHWRYELDYEIAKTCKKAGAKNCSTDAGAKAWGEDCKGMGTIPHALQTIYHWKYGLDKAVVESTKAFNRHIPKEIPRIALIDYANRELSDTMGCIKHLGKDLFGIRVDTCGENYMEGLPKYHSKKEIYQSKKEKYWFNHGVSIAGVHKIASHLRITARDVKIILSSGFGNPEKVEAFLEAEELLGMKLFDSLGVGGVFDSRMATMDIVRVSGLDIHKKGRKYKKNPRLNKIF